MPHLTIEYSANVADHHDIDALVEAVHWAALDHGLPPLAGLRTRAVGRTHYRIADDDPANAYIAIEARIGPGRDAETKRSFLTSVLDAAEARLRDEAGVHPEALAIAWSMELVEIDADFRINRNHIRDRLSN